ncbi:MAG: hypothetical protein ACQESP_09040 [Candidatus Muiribacteriota bacterium]
MYLKNMISVPVWGNYYLISSNPDITSIKDLSNKEIYIPQRGGPIDIIFSQLSNKLNLKNVNVNNAKSNQIAQLIINNMADSFNKF